MEKYIAAIAGVVLIPIATLLVRHFITRMISRFSGFTLVVNGSGIHFDLLMKTESKKEAATLLHE